MKKFIASQAPQIILAALLTIFGFTFHYDNDVLYISAVALVLTVLFFLYFSLVKKVRKFGVFLYLPLLILVYFIFSAIVDFSGGRREFLEWIFEQAEDNSGFAAASMVIMTFFFSSAIYYMTNILFRSVFVFVVCLTPLALYGKTYVEVPVFWIILIMVSFLSVIILCRKKDREEPAKIYSTKGSKTAVLAFACTAAVAAALLPKPETTLFRSTFDRFAKQRFGLSASFNPSGLYNSSDKNTGLNSPSDKVLFYVDAEEPTYLRKQVFDIFNGVNWDAIGKDEYNLGHYPWKDDRSYLSSQLLYSIIDAAYKADSGSMPDNTEELLREKTRESIKELSVFPATGHSIPAVMSNVNTVDIKPTNGAVIYKNKKDEYFPDNDIPPYTSYTIQYYSAHGLQKLAEIMDIEEYSDLLLSMRKTADKVPSAFTEKQKNALDYLISEVNSAKKYRNDTENDYEGREKINELASQITSGLKTDFEKAKAIEQYFFNGEFTYDLTFVPKKNTPDYFIFESKRGICSDFATSMVLLAREAGLAARYTEGFTATDYSYQYERYTVKESNAHAFAEVFIPGNGWMIFEATIPEADKSSIFDSLNIGFAVFALVSVIFIAVLNFFGKKIKEIFFRMSLVFRKNKLSALYVHLTKISMNTFDLEESISAGDLKKLFMCYFGEDISYLTDSFENLVYGNISSDKDSYKKCFRIYIEASDKLIKYKKPNK